MTKIKPQEPQGLQLQTAVASHPELLPDALQEEPPVNFSI